ncbi:uncharacterized protein VP01_3625g5 [Puccinia sorghi]|uniref:Uncharacterized protein n=1 Tax=Puccinia sorghi TaxID=27349 RepID=A0A0L6UVL6_9BASI|nr:uncharacterized protein VP01_3625g5 [Puccinia sorghi]
MFGQNNVRLNRGGRSKINPFLFPTLSSLGASSMLEWYGTTSSKTASSLIGNEDNSASALLTQKCPQGQHIPSATHTANNCFSLHPEKLTKYQNHLKNKQEDEANLAMFDSPSTFNSKAITTASPTIDDLAQSFKELPAHFSASASDGHESKVSLL